MRPLRGNRRTTMGRDVTSTAQRRRLLSVLPGAWRPALSRVRIEQIETGMSDASVFRLGASHYLKIAQDAAARDLREEVERTAWLWQHGVQVAPAVRVHDAGDFVALLSEAL